MIADHQWLAAASNLVEHSPGIVSSVIGIVIYALLRDGLPAFMAYRRRRNGNPGNPGNSNSAERLLACEAAIGEVRDACTRTDERWKAQEKFNDRMEEHVKNFYKRFEK